MNSIIKKLLSPAIKVHRLLKHPDYREYWYLKKRYSKHPRFKETKIALHAYGGGVFFVPDTASFLSTYEELLWRKIYEFQPQSDAPVILDFGANIGLSMYFWAKRYPAAQVYGYEPDPYIYGFLEKNVAAFQNGRLKIFNAALYDRETTLHFTSDHADGGHVSATGVEVPALDAAVELAKFKHIDMLKIDIEGSERAVLPRIAPLLERVDNVFVEYHSEQGKPQFLSDLLQILQKAGFRIFVQTELCAKQPFVQVALNSGFDLQLNIFGRRM